MGIEVGRACDVLLHSDSRGSRPDVSYERGTPLGEAHGEEVAREDGRRCEVVHRRGSVKGST